MFFVMLKELLDLVRYDSPESWIFCTPQYKQKARLDRDYVDLSGGDGQPR